MADEPLSTITEAVTAALSDLVYLVVGGNSRRMTLTNLKTVLGISTPTVKAAATGTTYTVLNTDLAGEVSQAFTNASDITITIPSGLTNTRPFTGFQGGAGQVIIVAGSGVTLLVPDARDRTRVQNSAFSIQPQGSEVYRLVGDIAEAP